MSDALRKALNIHAFGLIYVLLYEDNYNISTVRQSAPQTATTIKITSLQQELQFSLCLTPRWHFHLRMRGNAQPRVLLSICHVYTVLCSCSFRGFFFFLQASLSKQTRKTKTSSLEAWKLGCFCHQNFTFTADDKTLQGSRITEVSSLNSHRKASLLIVLNQHHVVFLP